MSWSAKEIIENCIESNKMEQKAFQRDIESLLKRVVDLSLRSARLQLDIDQLERDVRKL
jgi:peptidoglycan hydrolase CwlO-like protein